MSAIILRPPTFSKAAAPANFKEPSISWLCEEWHITHSTLPMWKNKRNLRIQYQPLEPSDPSISKDNTDRLDNLVTYQSLDNDKISRVEGIDKAAGSDNSRGEWDWRGKGLLAITGSHWEILSWGEEDTGNKYMVSMFKKTLFTPAGVDVYSKHRAGLEGETLDGVKKALGEVDDDGIRKMADELFEVAIDDARPG